MENRDLSQADSELERQQAVTEVASTRKQKEKPARKLKEQGFLSKIPPFCVGVVVGALVVFGLVIYFCGVSALFPSNETKSEINIFELEHKIEASSDLTITKVRYADFAYVKDPKTIPIFLGKQMTLPFTENSTLIAYKGTIGLGFDVSNIKPDVNQEKKTITIKLPKIGILYDDFDNTKTQSFAIKKSVFNPSEFSDSNEVIGRIKTTEEYRVLKSKSTMEEARKNAEDVILDVISGWTPTAGYSVSFE